MTRPLANLQASLALLDALVRLGLEHLVLCPGSRSGPLALAAGGLARVGRIRLTTAIDERSAAFHALGIAAASGKAAAVITTSGTAVANLLPAAVEADRSCLPLLLLTADRPERLKHCGANQTVNQEEFLGSACRWCGQGVPEGLDQMPAAALEALADQAWSQAHRWPGPVHLNLPLEEPLHPDAVDQQTFWDDWLETATAPGPVPARPASFTCLRPDWQEGFALDPDRPGLVVAGPWRGHSNQREPHQQALCDWLERCGWPVLVDPLAAVPPELPAAIHGWDLLLPDQLTLPQGLDRHALQVLRLGSMPASRRLERWLQSLGGHQVLVSEGEQRPLDPLRLAAQWSGGLASWCEAIQPTPGRPNPRSEVLCRHWQQLDRGVRLQLARALPLQGPVSEPGLMRALPSLLPQECVVMLAASSPVRDWQAFALDAGSGRRCFSFRGASGIDGTLSLALGLARVHGSTLLLTGDLALLHDSNGWLLASPDGPPLLVLLIDNGGGGIFQQLPVPAAPQEAFEQLFAMPQVVDPIALAAAHGIPGRQLACLEDLPDALEWGWHQGGPALLRVCTDRAQDARLRQQLRRAIQAAHHNGAADGPLP